MGLPLSFVSKNTNSKHQNTNKSQTPIFNDRHLPGQKTLFGFSNFGHWNLFDICDLIFGISISKTPTKQIPSGDNQSLILWARIFTELRKTSILKFGEGFLHVTNEHFTHYSV